MSEGESALPAALEWLRELAFYEGQTVHSHLALAFLDAHLQCQTLGGLERPRCGLSVGLSASPSGELQTAPAACPKSPARRAWSQLAPEEGRLKAVGLTSAGAAEWSRYRGLAARRAALAEELAEALDTLPGAACAAALLRRLEDLNCAADLSVLGSVKALDAALRVVVQRRTPNGRA